MDKKITLVAESLQDFDTQEEINESSKGQLQRFLKNPEKRQKNFLAAYARQFGKSGGDKLKNAIAKLSLEKKLNLAKQSLKAFEDPKKAYAWFSIKGGKLAGAGAIGAKKGELGSELGQ